MFPFLRPMRPNRDKASQEIASSAEDEILMPHSDPKAAESLAHAIHNSGLAGPATLALHIAKPLAWAGGQMLWLLQPFFGAPRPGSNGSPFALSTLATLLEQEEGVDELAKQLDALSTKAEQ